jgi:hypothetical protein
MEVSDVAVTDNKDGSYTISFCPRQGGMLKFEVYINGTPAPNCSLTKQVKWVISDAHGKGPVTNGGRTMKGDGGYCCRVGGCYFDSGVHTWKVRLSNSHDHYGYNQTSAAEVGIIDYDEINAEIDKRNEKSVRNSSNVDIAQSKRKWVHNYSVQRGLVIDINFTLDMEKRTLNVKVVIPRYGNSGDRSTDYQFTARRVLPFFACSSATLSISLME